MVLLLVISDLNQLLDPINAGQNCSQGVATCEPGTCEELIAVIVQWIDEGSRPPICWLNGPANSGNLAVLQTVTEISNDKFLLSELL